MNGLTENDGNENDGPSELQEMKLAQKRQTFEATEYME